MLSYGFFLDLAIILLSTKLLGLMTRKIRMPQVVGALLAGLILGPALLNVVHESDFIDKMAELGVIVLMFSAGLETDLKELKKCGKASFIIAVLGVLLPLVGGLVVAGLFAGNLAHMTQKELLENIFIGVVLTATSVSITVETLREMGKLKSPSGTAILGAAVIDDVLGIIILTVISSFADPSVSIVSILVRILLFFVFAAICAFVFYYIFNKMSDKYGKKRRLPIYSLAFCLILAYIAEEFFGVADITGAFLAGIIISNVTHSDYVSEKLDITSYMLLSPIFFASIGIKTSVENMDMKIILFAVVLLIIAILTKVVGCGLGARMCGYESKEAVQIGVGMISRGEVALIVADKGASIGLMNHTYFAPLIIVVIITTIITPILLKVVYNNKNNKKVSMSR
ncbi:cation:proton antiporter [Vallitalea guaymasensis]|uniref:Cation:proton antiporter n=2 Tax=Vallitalea guaymasensis TaxID=1185412 RepID=A0A8J8SCN3_9FIRM|nr:cation:proton antiporter [Vallitalea guaymasensis]QUH29917.1 cation:proton antiporter [Vallitalea guaymasensis]